MKFNLLFIYACEEYVASLPVLFIPLVNRLRANFEIGFLLEFIGNTNEILAIFYFQFSNVSELAIRTASCWWKLIHNYLSTCRCLWAYLYPSQHKNSGKFFEKSLGVLNESLKSDLSLWDLFIYFPIESLFLRFNRSSLTTELYDVIISKIILNIWGWGFRITIKSVIRSKIQTN